MPRIRADEEGSEQGQYRSISERYATVMQSNYKGTNNLARRYFPYMSSLMAPSQRAPRLLLAPSTRGRPVNTSQTRRRAHRSLPLSLSLSNNNNNRRAPLSLSPRAAAVVGDTWRIGDEDDDGQAASWRAHARFVSFSTGISPVRFGLLMVPTTRTVRGFPEHS